MPETAFAVISRDLIASISSIGRSAGSAVSVGKGIRAGSCCRVGPCAPFRRLISDLNAGARP